MKVKFLRDLGLTGIPSYAEAMIVERDLWLLKILNVDIMLAIFPQKKQLK